MSAHVNHIMIAGNLTRDPEMNTTTNGTPVTNFRVATSRRAGKDKERSTFIDCAAFSKLAEIIMQYAKVGTNVLVIGTLDEDEWTDQDGNKRFKHYITVDTFRVLSGFKDADNTDTF